MQKRPPFLSVIVIGRRDRDFDEIRLHLSRQRYSDYELITETGGSIPEAWNRAVRRARGEYLLFTETDARPLSEYWLDEMVKLIDGEHDVIKGMEVVGTPWNLCNTLFRREIFENHLFDESFAWAEDTELFSRLSAAGYSLARKEAAFLYHDYVPHSPKALRRAFRYGLNWMRIRHRYPNPVEVASLRLSLRRAAIALLQGLGMLAGALLFWPERRFRHQTSRVEKKPETVAPRTTHVNGSTLSSLSTKRSETELELLYIAPFPPVRSGIATYAQQFLGALRQGDKNLTVYAYPDTGQRPATSTSLEKELIAFHRHIRAREPDVIHIELAYGLLREFYFLYTLPDDLLPRVLVTVHDPPALCGEPLRFLPRLTGDLQGLLWPDRVAEHAFLMERQAFHRVGALFSLSHRGIALLKEQFGNRGEIHYLPHGASPMPQQGSAIKDTDRPVRLLYFGYLHAGKGVDVLLDALALLPDARLSLDIAGAPYELSSDGEFRNEAYLQQLLSKAGAPGLRDRVRFRGYIPDAQVAELFRQADILVLPYRASGLASGSGVLIRGMGQGLAVLCSRARSLPELVRHEENGWLVPPEKPEALALSIQRLAGDPALRARLGQAARADILHNHSWEKVAVQAVEVYRHLAPAKPTVKAQRISNA